jgi:hypothetical protein
MAIESSCHLVCGKESIKLAKRLAGQFWGSLATVRLKKNMLAFLCMTQKYTNFSENLLGLIAQTNPPNLKRHDPNFQQLHCNEFRFIAPPTSPTDFGSLNCFVLPRNRHCYWRMNNGKISLTYCFY